MSSALRGQGSGRKGFLDFCRLAVRMQMKRVKESEGAQGLGWLNLISSLQSTNDSVLAVGFSPRDSSCIVTSGKSHVHFWNWSGGAGVPGNGALTRKQGVFGVRCGCVQGQGGQSGDGSVGLRTLMLPNSQLSRDFWFLLFPLLSACFSPRNTRNPSLSLALCSSLMETFSLGTQRGTFSPGGGASQIARPQAGVGPKVCGCGWRLGSLVPQRVCGNRGLPFFFLL